MTLRHFKVFLAACERGSMTAAAEHLRMAQPSVSQCVAELERHYGLALFERIGRSIRITEAGKTLRMYASQILRGVDEAERDLFELQDSGSLRVGASMTVGTALLPSILERFLSTRPRLRLKLKVDNTAAVIEGLQSAELDVGLVEGLSEWPGIVSEAFFEDELRLICSGSHEWARVGSIAAADLGGRAFIVREQGSGTREVFAAAMAEADLEWETSGVVNAAEAIIAMVERGLGISFVSGLIARPAAEAGKIASVKVRGLEIRRKFRIVRHRGKFVTEAMRDFVDLCNSSSRWRGVGGSASPLDFPTALI